MEHRPTRPRLPRGGKDEETVVDGDALVSVVRRAGPDVKAVILVGSWAREEAEAASDVDMVALWTRPHRAVQVGTFAERLVEILYLPVPPPTERPRRATLRGARILYDPDGLAATW